MMELLYVYFLLKIISAVVICHLLVRIVQFWEFARKINKIPGPKCVFPFGNALMYLLSKEETTLGVPGNAQENINSELAEAFHTYFNILEKRFFNPFMYITFLYNLTPYKRKETKCVKMIQTFALKVIQKKRQYLEQCKLQQNMENGGKGTDENDIYGQKRSQAMLDLLLEGTCDGQKLNDSAILDEVIVSIAAGLESSAGLLSYTVFLLGCNPEEQKMAQQEVDNVLGESDLPITFDDTLKLKYLEAVLKETHRLYPPNPIIGRSMDEDVVIEGYTVPAGTTVGVVIYTIQRDPKVFPDPDKFDPERFLGTNASRLGPYDYIPFSKGPRSCIAFQTGLFVAKVFVSQILRKYDIISRDKPENLKLSAGPFLRSLHGLDISLCKRKLH